MAKLWSRWVDTKDEIYPRGVQGTWMRVWELVGTMPGIEEASTNYIAQRSATSRPTTPSTTATPPTPIAIATFSLERSNSVAIVAQYDDDDVDD